jgi:hypothetical protein
MIAGTQSWFPGKVPAQPDAADEAIRNARIMERRKQTGLAGRMSTFLTGGKGDEQNLVPDPTINKTLLGG